MNKKGVKKNIKKKKRKKKRKKEGNKNKETRCDNFDDNKVSQLRKYEKSYRK